MSRYTYQQLVELVDGDQALIELLVEEGEIVRRDDEHAMVDVEHVLIARTLLRDLEVDWPGIEVILRLRDELIAARRKIAELESTLAGK